jgi:transposase
LKRKHVTLLIIWDEYIAVNPGGYSYSRYVAAKIMLRGGLAWQAAGRVGKS